MLFIKNISKAFGNKTLFQNASLEIYEKECLGLLAPNGLGKTTLLNMILGSEKEYDGEISYQPQLLIRTIAQELTNLNQSLFDYAVSYFPQKEKLAEIRNLESLIHKDPENKSLLEKYSQAISLFERHGGYDFIYDIKKVLEGMGFLEKDFDRPLSSFSGGEKRRAVLSALLIQKPDILILDEPTNHLDIKNTIFLENFIKNYPKTIILVSHDREFLNNTVTHIAEIENGKLKKYKGNLFAFEKQKKENNEFLEKELKKLKDEYDHLFEFVSKFKAGTRSTQAASKEKRLFEVEEEMKSIQIITADYGIHFKERPRLKPSQLPLKADNLAKSYNGRELFSGISFTLEHKKRAVLVGINGSGKTTLFQILAQKIEPDEGSVLWRENVKVGYFTQERYQFESESTPYSHLLNRFGSKYLDQDLKLYLSNMRLKFDSPISGLSGGEKSKLKLLAILLDDVNFLLLDEPTNHLDIYSIGGLREMIEDFQGTVFMITHDRQIIRDLKPELFVLHEKKMSRVMNGNLDEVFEILGVYDFDKKTKKEKEIKVEPVKKTRNISRELQKLEKKIESLESELKKLEALGFQEEYYNDPDKYKSLEKEIQQIKETLAENYEEWEAIQNEA